MLVMEDTHPVVEATLTSWQTRLDTVKTLTEFIQSVDPGNCPNMENAMDEAAKVV